MNKYWILGTAVLCAVCFFVGRSTINTEIQYVKGKTIHDTIEVEKLVPYKVEVPANPILPIKDNLVDTAAIIEDHISKKSYSLVAFDNKEFGRLELFPTLQYNDLVKFDYSFTPVQQRVIVKPKFTPFVSASYSTLGYVGLGGGIFYHNLGFEYQYLKGRNNNGHSFGLKYKF